ncbi:MAG: 1-deoxy-D-xylulose-5-phosphate reductoisomerase, partial [Bacteroidales bacterium]|nr:1-deoxy-D-xylulose-5-phosphate reductoisomerase [Bacteroidales bacterium]
MKKRLAILGSTGSIGTQTLDIVRAFPEQFAVEVLTAQNNAGLLVEQAMAF